MLFAFLGLLAYLFVLRLITKLVVHAVRAFRRWLRGGRTAQGVSEERVAAEHAREVVLQDRDEAILNRTDEDGDKLTPEQQIEVVEVVGEAREEYLSGLRLSWYHVVIIFLVASVLGLLLEETWMLLTAGLRESRVGLVWGPFSPIYGVGAVLLTLLCWGLRTRHVDDYVVFLASMVVGGVLEQLAGWSMQTFLNASSWSYLHLPDHITQWVAWRFLIFWGLLGLVWYKVIMPELLFRLGSPTTARQVTLVALLAVYLAADIFMTGACFTRKAERDAGIPPENGFEVWVDENYTDEFIASTFQNLVIGE